MVRKPFTYFCAEVDLVFWILYYMSFIRVNEHDIVFLQLADVVRVDRLTRSDGFLNLLHGKRPRLTANLRRIINALSAIFMGLIAYITFPEFLHMWDTQDYFGVPGLFTLPWWPVKLVIALGKVQ